MSWSNEVIRMRSLSYTINVLLRKDIRKLVVSLFSSSVTCIKEKSSTSLERVLSRN